MNVVIEINGELHRMVKTSKVLNPCRRCSLKKPCTGRYCKTRRMIYKLCCAAYCGFRKIKEKNNE